MQKLWRIRRNFAIFRRKLDLKLHFGTYFGASAPKISEFKGQNKSTRLCTLYFADPPREGGRSPDFCPRGDASPSSPMHRTPRPREGGRTRSGSKKFLEGAKKIRKIFLLQKRAAPDAGGLLKGAHKRIEMLCISQIFFAVCIASTYDMFNYSTTE